MSKTVKGYMIRDYQDRLGEYEDALVISIRGMGGNDNNAFRAKLAEKDIRIMTIRNALAKHAFEESKLKALVPVLEGPSALAFGAESVVDVARELLKFKDQIEELEFKGGCIEGELFAGEAGVEQLSRLPTREEAIAGVVGAIMGPARNLAGAAVGPASVIAGCLKAIEAKLEDGEEITRKAG